MSDALVVAWSTESSRVGEVLMLPDEGAAVLGRGDSEEPSRAFFARVRPGVVEPRPPLSARAISRRQLELRPSLGGILVRRVGRCEMSVSSRVCDEALVCPGDTVLLAGQLLLLCVSRPEMPESPGGPAFSFGEADAIGLVGESAATHRLRADVAHEASREDRLLLTGATPRERAIVARGIHDGSSRASRPFVSRDHVTLDDALEDDELFGTGKAGGGTLFVEELADLAPDVAAHLLRSSDERRSRSRRVRLLAGTSDPDRLPPALAARFAERLPIPDLAQRREDLPFLVRHLLRRLSEHDPTVARRFFDEAGEPRVAPELIDALLRHRYASGVRELWQILRSAAETSRGRLEMTREVAIRLAPSADATIPPLADTTGAFPTRETIQAALARAEGSMSRAAESLGLSGRAALQRLMKKRGMNGAQ